VELSFPALLIAVIDSATLFITSSRPSLTLGKRSPRSTLRLLGLALSVDVGIYGLYLLPSSIRAHFGAILVIKLRASMSSFDSPHRKA
jgi:hypothetical protein